MMEGLQERRAPMDDRPWTSGSWSPARPDWLRLRWKLLILVGVIAAHAVVVTQLMRLIGTREPADETVLVLEFTNRDLPEPVPEPALPTERPELPPPVPRQRTPATPTPPASPRPARTRPTRTTDVPLRALPSPAHGEPLRLYDKEGRLRVPDDLLEQIDRKYGDKRDFSYQIPRMDDAARLLGRNLPITYESTRFDQYWKPDQDLLTDVLTQLVERTTKQIRLPVPGSPGTTMVCSVSLLALGGGCGILTAGADYVGPVDDPATLSPDEDRQCKAWWDQIVGAITQDGWRKTRRLYEQECRKPLLRLPPEPPEERP